MIPEEFAPYLIPTVAAAAGILVGWLISRVASSGKISTAEERIKGEERRSADLETRLTHAEAESEKHEKESHAFRSRVAELEANLEFELKAATEKQALLDRAETKLSDTFKALSADALKASNEQFLQLAKSSLATQTEEAKGEIEKRKAAIENLVKPVAESLGKFEIRIGEIEKLREGAYAELKEQVKNLGEGQQDLKRETAALVKALRQPTGRGQWGEMQLKRVVELAGMQEHCDFETQQNSTNDEGKRLRPDLVVRLPGGKSIVVDAKTPMDAFLDALEATDDATRDDALQRHARQVRTHIQQLSSKNYTSQFDQAPEFTVLFLPSESFFSAALQSDPGLIEKGVEQSVILATPTTLIALLRSVAYGWRQEAVAANAREICALGRTLHERLGKLADHFTKLGRSLGSAVQHYNSAIGSFETRVLSSARKFEDLKATSEGKTIENLEPVDQNPREIQTANLPDATDEEPQEDASNNALEPSDDFGFVPDPPDSSKGAANDLRSELDS